jgi:hypothetical protein
MEKVAPAPTIEGKKDIDNCSTETDEEKNTEPEDLPRRVEGDLVWNVDTESWFLFVSEPCCSVELVSYVLG